MTHRKRRLSFLNRAKRRPPRRDGDPATVFKTFVHVLAQMQAHARNGASSAPFPEKG